MNRDKTAIHRNKMSVPTRIALGMGLLEKGFKILDYGCGRGFDVCALDRMGFNIVGYDPFQTEFANDGVLIDNYDLCFCNYVLNVIPDHRERINTIYDVLQLSDTAVFAVRSDEKAIKDSWTKYKDGWITSKGTFQKFYSISELVKELNKSQYMTQYKLHIEVLKNTSSTISVLVRKCLK